MSNLNIMTPPNFKLWKKDLPAQRNNRCEPNWQKAISCTQQFKHLPTSQLRSTNLNKTKTVMMLCIKVDESNHSLQLT
jgi:hypothetical protein